MHTRLLPSAALAGLFAHAATHGMHQPCRHLLPPRCADRSEPGHARGSAAGRPGALCQGEQTTEPVVAAAELVGRKDLQLLTRADVPLQHAVGGLMALLLTPGPHPCCALCTFVCVQIMELPEASKEQLQDAWKAWMQEAGGCSTRRLGASCSCRVVRHSATCFTALHLL